jgi:1-acyl-sn-glycerol-3-phosphate acyltransferase
MLYHLLKWSVVSPVLHSYFQGRIYGDKQIPQSGPMVVVCNHGSYFDPPLLSCAMRRPVAFMAKQELFKVPVLKQAIALYGAYPVKRGAGDRGAIRAAISMLKAGWLVGIFLEGTRTDDGCIYHPKLGAALIAAQAQVPILPVCLWGTQKILRRGSNLPRPVPITVRIGDHINPPVSTDKSLLTAVTQQCAQVINDLHALGR